MLSPPTCRSNGWAHSRRTKSGEFFEPVWFFLPVHGYEIVHAIIDCRIRNNTIMRALVTGSAGHLGEALVRRLQDLKHDATGLDILASLFTTHVGSITDRSCVRNCMNG